MSEIEVSILSGPDAACDEFVRHAPGAKLCHLWAWGQMVQQVSGHRNCYLVAREGQNVRGVLPLTHVRSLLFGNLAYPLIRYQVGDLAVLPAAPVACGKCHSPVVESIYGRTAQTLISKDGRRISNISVIAKRCHHVEAMQCVQIEPGAVTIRVQKGAGFMADDEREIIRQFGLKMGQMDFDIEYVDRIERTASGKFLSIVSKVPPDGQAGMSQPPAGSPPCSGESG